MPTFHDFVAEHAEFSFAPSFVGVGSFPNGKDAAYQWRITLTFEGRSWSTNFYMGLGNAVTERFGRGIPATGEMLRAASGKHTLGYAHVSPRTPTAPEVLQSLQHDCASAEHLLFEDFAAEYGYDTDSRAAEAIWRQCIEIKGQLQKLFRGDFETFTACTEE